MLLEGSGGIISRGVVKLFIVPGDCNGDFL